MTSFSSMTVTPSLVSPAVCARTSIVAAGVKSNAIRLAFSRIRIVTTFYRVVPVLEVCVAAQQRRLLPALRRADQDEPSKDRGDVGIPIQVVGRVAEPQREMRHPVRAVRGSLCRHLCSDSSKCGYPGVPTSAPVGSWQSRTVCPACRIDSQGASEDCILAIALQS